MWFRIHYMCTCELYFWKFMLMFLQTLTAKHLESETSVSSLREEVKKLTAQGLIMSIIAVVSECNAALKQCTEYFCNWCILFKLLHAA